MQKSLSRKSLAEIKSIEDFELKGRRLLLRLDLNVPIKDGAIQDETRIRASLPTIRFAIDSGAKVVLASHLGRPKSPEDKSASLEPVAERLRELLDQEVILVEEPKSDVTKALLHTLRPGQIILLENLRYHPDETKNGAKLSDSLSSFTDVYINDAFGASHRAHASIVGVPERVKEKGIGFLMKKEVDMLSQLLTSPESPYVAVLGGAKVSDKIGIIENLVDRVDQFLIGGAMAYTFLAAQEIEVGKSLVEKDKLKYARELLGRMEARSKVLVLPEDHIIVPQLTMKDHAKVTPSSAIDNDWMGVDIGPKTLLRYSRILKNAKTVFWNGPMGIFETPEYSQGTFGVARAIAESEAFSVIGGGDSASAVNQSGYGDQVSHISTGGGASLEFLQGSPLPGLEALRH